MGYYTRIDVDLRLRVDTPAEVVQTLLWMAGIIGQDIEPHPPLPDNELFRTERWAIMLRCSYAHHQPIRTWDPRTRRLLVKDSHFKHHDSEIPAFARWVLPYTEAQPHPFIDTENEDHWVWRASTTGRYETFWSDYYGDEGGERDRSEGAL